MFLLCLHVLQLFVLDLCELLQSLFYSLCIALQPHITLQGLIQITPTNCILLKRYNRNFA